ncbi:MAG: sulfatase-like hydrolase/transferase, partial [Pirellulales bacterium]|nr:sulfatase-like hydrolase/transferase [Pirellulales bacterium]
MRLIWWMLLGWFGAALAVASSRPDILVILVDDAGYNDFGFMGSPDIATPQLDRLAAMGTVLTDAHVTAAVCSPSRAGLLTGRYQQRFGHEGNVPSDDQGLDPAEDLIGDVLRTVGYRTIAIGKWHVGNRTMHHPNTRGFDEFWGFLEGARSYFPDPSVDYPGNHRSIQHNRRQMDFEGYLTDVLTDRALAYMDESGERPWFIYLSYNAVHTPMEAKAEDLERFAGHPRQKLAAMTWSLDQNVGRILDHLEANDRLDQTLIFFLSDNGGAGMHNNQSRNGPLKGWKGNKFEGGHRVPFIVSW